MGERAGTEAGGTPLARGTSGLLRLAAWLEVGAKVRVAVRLKAVAAVFWDV